MRTTLTIDDDVLAEARLIAARRHLPVSAVASELMRRGLAPEVTALDERDGFPVFRASSGAKPITGADVDAALDDDWP
jgi:hypothetical protein